MKVKYSNSLEFQLNIQLPQALGIEVANHFNNFEFGKNKKINQVQVLDSGRCLHMTSAQVINGNDVARLKSKLKNFLVSKL